ncbi:triacylglycerol lipase [Photobacterium sp. 1_MG-2023]|uniref:esterase/lipase family protein n=1 Tax=Photobacterium sp. 1_MG-2023 TaxID=3062646 RepID=UPI0026E40A6D|nr:alpha/beta fold hydrolase [Photobacterium sp. 1_MG-2023]MDO6706833.1 alpha/beta fold hydrolase [Photobacterium sp. 1_MG-2023]
MYAFILLFLMSLFAAPSTMAAQAENTQPGCVILLHGLARTAHSMDKLADALSDAGYQIVNVDYPSTQYPIETLAATVIPDALSQCNHTQPVHFVTHSMGGILVRQYLSQHDLNNLGRVVMLAPPNQGSEVVDSFHDVALFQWIYGPAGQQLSTETSSVPKQLGPVHFDLGVIAGNRSLDFLTSWPLPEPHDGKVSVASTRVEGMHAHLVLPATHTFIMRDETVIAQVIYFLQHGRFQP